jgi:hypothetical protein
MRNLYRRYGEGSEEDPEENDDEPVRTAGDDAFIDDEGVAPEVRPLYKSTNPVNPTRSLESAWSGFINPRACQVRNWFHQAFAFTCKLHRLHRGPLGRRRWGCTS